MVIHTKLSQIRLQLLWIHRNQGSNIKVLEQLFRNTKVDMVKNGLSPYIGPEILNEVHLSKEPIEYLKQITYRVSQRKNIKI